MLLHYHSIIPLYYLATILCFFQYYNLIISYHYNLHSATTTLLWDYNIRRFYDHTVILSSYHTAYDYTTRHCMFAFLIVQINKHECKPIYTSFKQSNTMKMLQPNPKTLLIYDYQIIQYTLQLVHYRQLKLRLRHLNESRAKCVNRYRMIKSLRHWKSLQSFRR